MTTVDFRPEHCTCGCGATTQRRFRSGHDLKLKSALRLSHRECRNVKVRLGDRRLEVSALEAASYLKTARSDWPAYVTG